MKSVEWAFIRFLVLFIYGLSSAKKYILCKFEQKISFSVIFRKLFMKIKTACQEASEVWIR